MKTLYYQNQTFIFYTDEFRCQQEYHEQTAIPGSTYNRKTAKVEAPWWMVNQVEEVAKTWGYEYDSLDEGITDARIDVIANIEHSCDDGHDREKSRYFPFQKAGIMHAAHRNDSLLADEMGLGKTIQAIGILNVSMWQRVLIVTPASLRVNWKAELEEWLDIKVSIELPNKTFKLGNITIINYAKLGKFADELSKTHFDYAIFDESHYLKSPKAKRTKLCFGAKKVIHADRRIFITGTPILNRPIEIFPLLRELGVEKNYKRFVYQFCDAKEKVVYTKQGRVNTLDVSGSSNEDKLQEILRSTIMIRRLKKDVLPQLPAKIQQIVLLPDDGNIKNVKREKLEFAALMKEPNLALAISNLSELRQENAIKKIKFAKEYIDNILEQKQKVVVFAWHKIVIDELKEVLNSYNPLVITGSTPGDKRQSIVDEFQTGSSRVIVGNIKAMGTGLTLHAASDVVFLEMDWTPGMNTQAEDRIHRIGQDQVCHIHYLVYADSVDAFIARKVVKKKVVIEKILDGGVK